MKLNLKNFILWILIDKIIVDNYIVDFYIKSLGLAIEIYGGIMSLKRKNKN
jgi:very-short-patch-repair endonuclease